MELLLGPVLYARSQPSAEKWCFAVNLLLEGTTAEHPPALKLTFRGDDAKPVDAKVGAPVLAADFTHAGPEHGGQYWRWEVELERGEKARLVSYRFTLANGAGWALGEVEGVVIPARGALPRAAFFSCNGMSDNKQWSSIQEPFRLWGEVARQHAERAEDGEPAGFHLLIGGGDQIYADSLWDKVDELTRFRDLPRAKKVDYTPSPEFAPRMLTEYVKLYRERWKLEVGVGRMMARVPGLYTWDDHDIFDGWGSHEELQQSKVYAQVYAAAAQTFEAFQLGGDSPSRAPHFFRTAHFSGARCDLDVVLFDLRSGRTSKTAPSGKVEHMVMSPEQWAAFAAWRAEKAEAAAGGKKARHVLAVSGIPLVYMRFPAWAEAASRVVEMRDDMLDQWESPVHRGERVRMLMHLFELAKDANAAVTILSGDVHVGSRAVLRSRNVRHVRNGTTETLIEQVTSSGIVHPPPSALEFAGMKQLAAEGAEDLPGAMTTELLPVGGDRYLRERNWLNVRVLEKDGEPPKLWLKWEAEHSVVSTEVVVEAP